MSRIKIAIAGVGNCASSLVQGIEYYSSRAPEEAIGLMHWEIGGYRASDLEVVAAFDVDLRKVGKDIAEESPCWRVYVASVAESNRLATKSSALGTVWAPSTEARIPALTRGSSPRSVSTYPQVATPAPHLPLRVLPTEENGAWQGTDWTEVN